MSRLSRRFPSIRFPKGSNTADDNRRLPIVPGDDALVRQRSPDIGEMRRKPNSKTRSQLEDKESEESLNLLEQKEVKFNSRQPSPLCVEDEKEQKECDIELNRSNCNGRCKNRNITANSNQGTSKVNANSSTLPARDIDDDVFNAFLRRFRNMAPIKEIEISIVSGESIAEEEEEAEINERKPTLELPVTRLTVCTETNEVRDREVRYTKVSMLMVLMFLLCHIPRLVANAIEMLLIANCKKDNCIPTWYDILVSFNHLLIIANSAYNFVILLTLTSVSKKKLAALHDVPTNSVPTMSSTLVR